MEYIHTSFKFVHVCTLPAECRTSTFRKARPCSVDALIDERSNLPAHRQFRPDQIASMRDAAESPLAEGKVTIFPCRPPGLLFVRDLQTYFTYFTVCKEQYMLSDHVADDPWIDGLGHTVRLYPACRQQFEDYLAFLNQPGSDNFTLAKIEEIQRNLATGLVLHVSPDPTDNVPTAPIVVFSTVAPTSAMKFVCRVLLSLGHYETEHSLFKRIDLKEAFVAAGLTSSTNPPRRELLHVLTR